MLRYLYSTLLCAMFPGWGLCAVLCSAMPGESSACGAEVKAAHSCCTSHGSSASHSGCAHSSAGCACKHDASPAKSVHTPDAPSIDVPATPKLAWARSEFEVAAEQILRLPFEMREILVRHQRLNL